ncbi:MAG: hypothetical protein D6714_17870 [Bacteroidetes bacterium]|nr:MAG: hypothetical protein D6714_17870 [Bacteroidota bacterium]
MPVLRNILLLICLFCQASRAQSAFSLQIIPLDRDTSFLSKQVKHPSRFPDTIALKSALRSVVRQLQAQSFLEASVDRLEKKDSSFTAWLHVGPAYEWVSLKNGNIEAVFLNRVGFLEKIYARRPVSFVELSKLEEKLLTYAENNGYPFAAVWLDSLHISDNALTARLYMDKGPLIVLDSLKISGDVKISRTYMSNYLGLKEGSFYNKKKIIQARDRIRELSFLKEKSAPTVTFFNDKATVNLFLTKKKASRFDFLVGFLPNNNSTEKRLLLTGNFKAEMENQFGAGEKIYANFERLRPATQKLELAFTYPYLLDLPFGTEVRFNQYKRDSTYSDVVFDFGIQYLLEGGNYLKLFWNNASSNLLSVDTNRIKQGFRPPNLDVSNSSFGVEFSHQKTNYRYNPREGWRFFFRAGAGLKEIRENQAILKVSENFYDTLTLKSYQYKLDGRVERFFPVGRRSAILTKGQSGFILSDQPVYQNEQYRIGGNKLLRGFDEESIFATYFAVFTLEYRFLVGQNSYFNAFGDYAWLRDRTAGKNRTDRPFGFGLGLNFETTAGVFGFSLAVGSQQGTPPDFQNPKIHFGYVSLF